MPQANHSNYSMEGRVLYKFVFCWACPRLGDGSVRTGKVGGQEFGWCRAGRDPNP